MARKAARLAADEISAIESEVSVPHWDGLRPVLARILETGIQKTGVDRFKRDDALERTGNKQALALA